MLVRCRCGHKINFDLETDNIEVRLKCPNCSHHMKLQSDDLF